MSNQEEFERKLASILNKYKSSIESKDPEFITEYVSYCLDKEIVISPKRFQPHKQSTINLIFSVILKTLLVVLLILGLLLFAKHKIDTRKVDEYASDANYWLYFFRRWGIRLGINKYTAVKRLYESDCLIKNPYFVPEPRPCSCGFVLKRYALNSTEGAKAAFLRKLRSGNINPFIMKNALEFPVSYTDLRTVVTDSAIDFDSGNSFTRELGGSSLSSDYKDLFADPEQPPPLKNAVWEMNFVGAVHHLRKLFPRPFFVPSSQEINLGRSVYMFGALAPSGLVKIADDTQAFAGAIYIQAWGRRRYALKSDASCNCKKESLAFILNQGDLLYYPGDTLDLYSMPMKNSTTYTLGYLGSVATTVSSED